ncbi:hypothetical protein Pav631_3027 [Pseudomonas avellanae BPIC 631]|nr:hypothetical protein Pav631_3027 [Pseudomonas avellanae BPIC 631]
MTDAFRQHRCCGDDQAGGQCRVEKQQHLGDAHRSQKHRIVQHRDIDQRQNVDEKYRKQAQGTGTGGHNDMLRYAALGKSCAGVGHQCFSKGLMSPEYRAQTMIMIVCRVAIF